MHLKVVFSLLMLSSLFLQSDCLTTKTYFVANYGSSQPLQDGMAIPVTVGSYSLFGGAFGHFQFYGFNAETKSIIVNNDMYATILDYATVGDLAFLLSRNTYDAPISVFNGTSGESWELRYGPRNNFYQSLTSLGQYFFVAGGGYYDAELQAYMDLNTVGIFDTTTQTFSNVTLPFSRNSLTSTSVGNYALFGGGSAGQEKKTDVAILDITTRTVSTASLTANDNLQAVSVGRFAIFTSGNNADVFDSNSKTWSKHTLSQSAPQVGFNIVKTQRYAFFVTSGKADVFDSNSQTWSTLIIDASTTATYCPSSVVGKYALFTCGNLVHIFDSSRFEFLRIIDLTNNYFQIIAAGSVGNIATFLVRKGEMYIYTMDFSTGAPNSDMLTAQVVSPTSVSATLSTHQLSKTRTRHTVAGNKAVFIGGDNSVDIYNAAANTWSTSTPDVTSRGDLLATCDSFVVFTDSANKSFLNVLDLSSSEWSVVELVPETRDFLIAVGDYLFYAKIGVFNSIDGTIAYSLVNKSWTSLPWMGYSLAGLLVPQKYKSLAVFVNAGARTDNTNGFDTANNLARTGFSYGGQSRTLPNIATAGDYLVIAGGIIDGGFSDDYSIRNPQTGEEYIGKLPSSHRYLTVVYVDPYMMFIDGASIEFLNLETGAWTVGYLDVSLTNYGVSGHKLFTSDNNQRWVAAFDSHTTTWYNVTLTGGAPIGKLSVLGDLATFISSNSIIVYNPNGDKWTQSFFAGKQFKEVFSVGNTAVSVSINGQTVDTVAWSTLTTVTTPPPINTPTQSPSTEVPWSPWMPPTPPSVPSSPSTPTSSPLSQATPQTSSSAPTSGSTPTGPSTTPSSSPLSQPNTTPSTAGSPSTNTDSNQQISSAVILNGLKSLMFATATILLLL